MNGIFSNVTQTLWRRQVVTQPTNGVGTGRTASSNVAPDAEQVHQKVASEFDGQHLRNDVQIGDEGRLQDDGNVGRVKQLDGVGRILAAITGRLDGQVDTEALEVYDYGKDEDGSQQVHQVGQILAVKGFAKSANLVLSGGQQMEQGNNGAFEFSASASVDCRRAERFPYDRFANVGGDKEWDTRAETVTFLEELVKQQDNQAGDKQLDDDQQANTATNFTRFTVHARHDVHNRLTDRDDHTENCWKQTYA